MSDTYRVRSAKPSASALLEREGLAYELKYLNRHLPDTPQSPKLIEREGAAHVFRGEHGDSQALGF